MDPSRLLHPLAPRPSGLGGHADGGRPQRRTNISMACGACKTRKSKCDGGLPCQSCSKRHSDCTYNEDTDNRRRLSMKRRIESLEEDRTLLLQLVRFLRDRDDSCITAVVNLVRTNVPLSQLRSFLEAREPEGITPEPVETHSDEAHSEMLAAQDPSESL